MKSKVAKAVWLVIWGGLIYLLIHITYVLRTDTDEKRNLMGFYYEQADTLDAVFIGSSSLWSSISPLSIYDEYGITSYIIATSAQRPSSLYYLLKEAQKTQPNAVYFIDISTAQYENEVWAEQNEGSVRRVTDGLKYSMNRLACNYEQTKGRKNKISYYVDIIKYHSEWRNFWKNRSHWNFEVENPNKGFNMLTSLTPLEAFTWREEKNIPICPEAEQTLRKLLEYCRKKELNVEFTMAVSTGASYGKAVYMRELVESYGFNLFIFNEHLQDMQIDYSKDFADAFHLNVSGAKKASSYFGKYIVDKYSFPDIRENVNYAAWDMNAVALREKMDSSIVTIESGLWIGQLTVDYQIDGNKITFINTSKAGGQVETAWYANERVEGTDEYKQVYTQWWSPTTNEFVYEYDTNKEYQIVLFVRLIENPDVRKYDYVVQFHFDGTEWIFK